MTITQAGRDGGELGALLRHWRRVRGTSQLDLALQAGVSQRHLSFVETGRSTPSRDTLGRLADALRVPFRDRNLLLLAAGYAPGYVEDGLGTPEMRSVTVAIERMLRQHEPFPAFVLDRAWDVVLANDAARRFLNRFFDLDALPRPRNLLRIMLGTHAMRPFIHEWDTVAEALIGRVHREAVGGVADGRVRTLIDELMAFPGVRSDWRRFTPAASAPVVPIGFVHAGLVLNYFSLVSVVGTPRSILTQELRVECMFPADEATEPRHLALMAEAPPGGRPEGSRKLS